MIYTRYGQVLKEQVFGQLHASDYVDHLPVY